MVRAAPRLLVAVVLSLLAVALAATTVHPRPAYAHGQLAVSTPTDGATLSAPVESVSLAFTEQPPSFAYFTVTAPNGARVDRRWSPGAQIRLEKPVREYQRIDGVWQPQLYHVGFTVQVPVAYWPEQGRYVVRYQSVASDGEEVKGELKFTYTGKDTPAPAGWQAPTDQPSPELVAAASAGHGQSTAAASTPAGAPPSESVGAPGTGQDDDGLATSVWLVPVLLLVGAAVLIVGVARRPARAGKPATHPRNSSTRPRNNSTRSGAASRSGGQGGAPERRRSGPAAASNRRKRR
ncbi:copper resistance protein CopC [Plantactinospora sp. WMMB782]|uniref:copper resistance CopC family protein n=1 Tax=Plantactinospora sp. WMMB782 TaxID=3404121 RepID=UPI003B93BA2F